MITNILIIALQAKLRSMNLVLEIGPGTGNLTVKLLRYSNKSLPWTCEWLPKCKSVFRTGTSNTQRQQAKKHSLIV